MINVSKITVNGNDYDIKDTEARSGLSNKQDTLVSGTNIKTVNGNSLLGSGNIAIKTNTDDETISYNSSDALQVIAVKNKRDDSTLPIWHGSEYQWNTGGIKNWYNWQTDITALFTSGNSIPYLKGKNGWKTLIYANNLYVSTRYDGNVYEDNGGLAYSSDGINWNLGNMPYYNDWYNIAYGNNTFVSVSPYFIAYSSDGINWSGFQYGSQEEPKGLLFADDKFIFLLRNAKTLYYSSDGINWSNKTISPISDFFSIYSIAYGNNTWVILGYNHNTYTSFIMYSNDFINWYIVNFNNSESENNSICFGSGKFIWISSDKYIYYSIDGINWDYIYNNNLPSGPWDLNYVNNVFIGSNGSNKIIYSIDGLNWNITEVNESGNYKYAIYDGEKITLLKYNSESTIDFSVSVDKCYTDILNPTTTSVVYSTPETASALTVSSVTSGAITLSNNNTYYYNQSGNIQTYNTVGDTYPEYLCFIDGVGVKMGNTLIASATPITTTITSISTDTEVPSAKAVYNEIGEVESALNTINSGS